LKGPTLEKREYGGEKRFWYFRTSARDSGKAAAKEKEAGVEKWKRYARKTWGSVECRRGRLIKNRQKGARECGWWVPKARWGVRP